MPDDGLASHNDLTGRFPLIVEALARLRPRSVIIDGEAVCCGDDGVPSFDRLRYCRHNASVFLYAFEVIEVNGGDLRGDALEVRKASLASLLKRAGPGLRFNEHIEADGPTVFAHACKMGLEGIVSKRKDSSYRSGRSSDWLKMPDVRGGAAGGGGGLGQMTGKTQVKKSWQLADQHGLWWAYEGDLPPLELFRPTPPPTDTRAIPLPRGREALLPRHLDRRRCSSSNALH